MAKKALVKALEDIVGPEYVSDADFICAAYARNTDAALPDRPPDVVVRPGSVEEVQKIVRIANRFKVPIYQRGAGLDLMGGAKPIEEGGIVMDLTRMNKIIEIDEQNQVVIAECGISWSELNKPLFEKGFYTGCMGAGSSQSATLGGALSNNTSGGGGAALYGTASDNCIGLEVVLPQGDVIRTGSWASVYVKTPFCRYVLGPDFTGLFLGDNGILGIKTKAAMRIYPKPKFVGYKTWHMPAEGEVERATKIFLEISREGGLGCWDVYYQPAFITTILTDLDVIKGWKGLRDRATMWYVTVAYSQEELDANMRKLDEIFKKHGCEPFGDKIEEGNFARYYWELQGHWTYYHYFWGGLGPGSCPTADCYMIPITDLPRVVKLHDEWYEKRMEWFQKAGGAISGWVVFLAGPAPPQHLDFVHGFVQFLQPEYREINRKIWLDYIHNVLIKYGGCNYWLGEVGSRALIDAGAFTGPYYNFLRTIKYALDPNRILSPGKFYL
jgi:FAD/FMN-containing dehydrogenase